MHAAPQAGQFPETVLVALGQESQVDQGGQAAQEAHITQAVQEVEEVQQRPASQEGAGGGADLEDILPQFHGNIKRAAIFRQSDGEVGIMQGFFIYERETKLVLEHWDDTEYWKKNGITFAGEHFPEVLKKDNYLIGARPGYKGGLMLEKTKTMVILGVWDETNDTKKAILSVNEVAQKLIRAGH